MRGLRLGSGGLLACLLGAAAALLVSCGGTSAKLIPVADAGPLQSDFEAIAHAAEEGNGSCSGTETAIAKTEQDFNGLPASVDAGLRATLRQGIDNLRSHALALCAQPLAQTTATSTPLKTTSTSTTSTTTTPVTTPTSTQTTTAPTTTPSTTPTTPGPGGGTPAPGVGEEAPAGGTGAGEGAVGAPAAPEAGAGASVGGQEPVK